MSYVLSLISTLLISPANGLSDYYAALLRTRNHAFIAPTHGKVMNVVERVPLGVVAQITVGCSSVNEVLTKFMTAI
jgi:acyl-CoA reductase-like NAD-dependent aldehyde dehydrogenase